METADVRVLVVPGDRRPFKVEVSSDDGKTWKELATVDGTEYRISKQGSRVTLSLLIGPYAPHSARVVMKQSDDEQESFHVDHQEKPVTVTIHNQAPSEGVDPTIAAQQLAHELRHRDKL